MGSGLTASAQPPGAAWTTSPHRLAGRKESDWTSVFSDVMMEIQV